MRSRRHFFVRSYLAAASCNVLCQSGTGARCSFGHDLRKVHSITPSALSWIAGDSSTPNVLAVLRLMTNSILWPAQRGDRLGGAPRCAISHTAAEIMSRCTGGDVRLSSHGNACDGRYKGARDMGPISDFTAPTFSRMAKGNIEETKANSSKYRHYVEKRFRSYSLDAPSAEPRT
jgi:hypothetical protein